VYALSLSKRHSKLKRSLPRQRLVSITISPDIYIYTTQQHAPSDFFEPVRAGAVCAGICENNFLGICADVCVPFSALSGDLVLAGTPAAAAALRRRVFVPRAPPPVLCTAE
jgi:hypothetical protein